MAPHVYYGLLFFVGLAAAVAFCKEYTEPFLDDAGKTELPKTSYGYGTIIVSVFGTFWIVIAAFSLAITERRQLPIGVGCHFISLIFSLAMVVQYARNLPT